MNNKIYSWDCIGKYNFRKRAKLLRIKTHTTQNAQTKRIATK